jgi:hypothetical protein
LRKRNLRRGNSGQVIVITSLLVAVILLSTVIFVIETEKATPTTENGEGNVFPAYEQSIKNTLISVLANVSNGGEANVLNTDLDELKLALTSTSYDSIIKLDYTPLNLAPYKDGLWISWSTDGKGVSSAYVGYVFNSSRFATASNIGSSINITSAVTLRGSYLQLNGTFKQADLTITLQNEGKPALAQGFKFYFQNETNWIKADSPSITDFGNGTYSVVFNAETGLQSNPFLVSMYCLDQRNIIVSANATCVST